MWWREWLYILLLLHKRNAFGYDTVSLTFTRIYDGGTKINVPYTSFQAFSRTICSAICQNKSGCWLFTWDTATGECRIQTSIQSVITTLTASPTLQSYYVSSINDKKITKSPLKGNWYQVGKACEGLNGSLYLPPDSSYSFVLHHVFGTGMFWTGMYREFSVESVWYSMEGYVVSQRPDWKPGQPNNYNGTQYCTAVVNGFLLDVDYDEDVLYGLCEL
ncbi:hypothetical protein SK128_001713 [Halocaridina rubra]|uniref:C-type lectin domain-containing protein n=1 Tax=Halocaridina rubra TaxID=373956 RepID=A0AAN9A6T3_HALRR